MNSLAPKTRHGMADGSVMSQPEALICTIRSSVEMTACRSEWLELWDDSCTHHLSYHPDYAIPALEVFGDGVGCLVITDPVNGGRLMGLWPMAIRRRRWGLPLPVAAGWTHPFVSMGTPLVRRGHMDDVVAALLRAPGSVDGLPPRMMFPLQQHGEPFCEALQRQCDHSGRRFAAFNTHDRAILDRRDGRVPGQPLSGGTLRKLGQELRRLRKQGTIHFETVTRPEEIAVAFDAYVDLEGAGWKARSGTSLADRQRERRFLKSAVLNFAERNLARIDRLCLDGKAIASSITFQSIDGLIWYKKISFDERHRRNSPGSQLVLYVTESFLKDPHITYCDSCAPPEHPLMRRFWPDRVTLSNILVEPARGDRMFPLVRFLEALRSSIVLQKDRLATRQRQRREAKMRAEEARGETS